jgi:hypothetical protein
MKCMMWTFALMAISMSCGQNTAENSSDLEINSFSEESNMSFFNDLISEIKATPLNTGDILMGTSGAFKMTKADNKFLITDLQTNSVFLFNDDGTLITHISKVGRGPGEYTGIQSSVFSNHKIIALADNGHIIEYSEDGEFEKESFLETSVSDFCLLDDGLFAFLVPLNEGESDIEDRVIIADSSYKQIKSFSSQQYQLYDFGSSLSKVQNDGDSFLHIQACSPRIEKCNNEGVINSYNINLHGKEFPESFVRAEDYDNLFNILTSTPEIYSILNAYENQDYLLFAVCFMSDGEEKEIGLWLLNKNDYSSNIEYINLSDNLFSFIGPPLMLTRNNEVVFICDASMYESVREDYPKFNALNTIISANPDNKIMLTCKLGH